MHSIRTRPPVRTERRRSVGRFGIVLLRKCASGSTRDGQTYEERAALSSLADDLHCALVAADDAEADGQTKAGPLAVRLRRVERLEDVLQVFGRDTHAAVGHRDGETRDPVGRAD